MPKYIRKSEKSRKVKRLEKPENTGNMRKIKILFATATFNGCCENLEFIGFLEN